MMKRILILFLFCSLSWAGIAENLFFEGNKHMVSENYNDAIQTYESILDLGYESSDLYYNLGNAYYRLNFIGQSIWAYMNAIELAPRDDDIKHNLSVANARIIDRVEIPNSFIILKYFRILRAFFTISEWFLIGSLLFLLKSLIFLGLKFGILRGKLFKITSSMLIFILLIVHIIAIDSYYQNYRSNTMVVIANGVDAYSGPFYGENSVLFRVNEGSIAEVFNMKEDWAEIILIDGKKGWITRESIRALK